MSRFTLSRTAGAVITALGLFAVAARAADPPAAADKPAESKRAVYLVKHRPAKGLAAVLSSSFQGVAVIQAVPDSFGDALLIRAAPSAFDDVLAAAEKLDRAPRTVALEVLAAQAAPDEAGLKDADFTGSAADVVARMEELRKKRVLIDLKRVHLDVVEGQPSSLLAGESKPNVMGIFTTPAGMASRSITYRDLGSQVRAAVTVAEDRLVTVDLQFEDSRAVTPDDGVSIGVDEKGKPAFAAEFLRSRWEGKVSLPDGQARTIQDVKNTSGKKRMILVVAAQVVEPEK